MKCFSSNQREIVVFSLLVSDAMKVAFQLTNLHGETFERSANLADITVYEYGCH